MRQPRALLNVSLINVTEVSGYYAGTVQKFLLV